MKHKFNYFKLNNGIIVLENHILKDGTLNILFNGFGILDDARNNTIGINHMIEHIYATYDHNIYDSNAYTSYHNMGFSICKKEKQNMIELIKLVTNNFSSMDNINKTNFDNLSKELENEYYFRSTFDRFNMVFKSNPSNDFYLGGRIISFKDRDLTKLLHDRYNEMMYADNLGFIINAPITQDMIKELNRYFGKLPSKYNNKTIVNGSTLSANYIYSNTDYLYLTFNLPYSIDSYLSSFYFNNYITKTLGDPNLSFDLNTDGYNFFYSIYNFSSYSQMYGLLKLLNGRSYFNNLSRYNIDNYYNLFQTDNNFFGRTYDIASPLFKYNTDLLYNFYSSEVNIMPYVRNTIPYFYALNDLYVVGYNNALLMNKQDINNILYNKIPIELDFSINRDSIHEDISKGSNFLSYFYLKYKDICFTNVLLVPEQYVNTKPKTIDTTPKYNNITIKYNYNIKNYLLHQLFRLFINTTKCNYINAIAINLDSYDDINNFFYLLAEKYNFSIIKSYIKKNELLFTMNLITNYAIYNNVFHPNEVLEFISTNTDSIKLNLYEINLSTTNTYNLEKLIESISLETKGLDLQKNIKEIKNESKTINGKFSYFIFVTDANLEYNNVLWDMKNLGLLYTLMFNKIEKYTCIRSSATHPEECVKYLRKLCNKHIKYSIVSQIKKN